jgi:hypothetical protein
MTDQHCRIIGLRGGALIRVMLLALSFLFCIITIANAGALPEDKAPFLPDDTDGKPPVAKDGGSTGFFSSVWQGLTDEANLRVGYGVVKWTMDIKRSSDGATATLVQRDNGAIFIGYGSKPSFFQDSSFGYTFMVNYVHFDFKNQEIPGDKYADFGTEIKGDLIYAVPTLYYQWGEHRFTGRFIRLGVGVGLGAAQFSGTVRLSTGEIVYTEKRSYEPRLAFSDFLEARWNQIGISISFASPRVYGDGYDIRVSDFSANIGYVYYF